MFEKNIKGKSIIRPNINFLSTTSNISKLSTIPNSDIIKKLINPILGGTLALSFVPFIEPAFSTEFDILAEDEPNTRFFIDDANVLSRTSRDDINNKLADLLQRTGFKLTVVTVRKLEFDPDVFSFSEKLFNKWYNSEQRSKNGILLVVTAAKDGALIGGDSLTKTLGYDLIDSVITDNIPVYTEEEKFNEAVSSSVDRITSVLTGKGDPGAPQRAKNVRKRTYKTKEETDRVKPVTGTIVVTLLIIAFVVPMLQYFGYVGDE